MFRPQVKLTVPNLEDQERDSLVHKEELQHKATKLGICERVHTSPSPLIIRKLQSGSVSKSLVSEHKLCLKARKKISSRNHLTSHTSSGSFPLRRFPVGQGLLPGIGPSSHPFLTIVQTTQHTTLMVHPENDEGDSMLDPARRPPGLPSSSDLRCLCGTRPKRCKAGHHDGRLLKHY